MTPTMTTVAERIKSGYFFLPGASEGFAAPAPVVGSREGKEFWAYSGVPVFRTGTFRNSMGIERTWDKTHLQTMVSNFDLLKSLDKLPDIPVRADHPNLFEGGSVRDIVGYVTGLELKDYTVPQTGETFTYLVADYEILDPEANDKIQRKLWRSRSAELGRYVTNSPEAEYWPTFMGFAYVDIGAVEHLNQFSRASVPDHLFGYTEGSHMPNKGETQEQHGSGQPAFTFSIGGTQCTDFLAVQRYITDLETTNKTLSEFREHAIEQERINYVKALSEGNTPKILASQVPALTALAKGMTPEQFAQFCDVYDKAAPNPVLGSHGHEQSNAPKSGEDSSAADPVRISKDVIATWKKTGAMSDEKIKTTEAYKTVIAADSTFTL